ncbi:hypothetical protein MRB53_002151 [Persea americana]|uniref:Uncharacterized protein n=1 Tax=Persea americana TaxID=3435 RepID=A0ACC2MUC5_PERAE|nr:hypothetical protein MRB53_002151 [Persea americana]
MRTPLFLPCPNPKVGPISCWLATSSYLLLDNGLLSDGYSNRGSSDQRPAGPQNHSFGISGEFHLTKLKLLEEEEEWDVYLLLPFQQSISHPW